MSKFCPRCGIEIDSDIKFCPACGYNIAKYGDEPVQPVRNVEPVEPVQPVEPIEYAQPAPLDEEPIIPVAAVAAEEPVTAEPEFEENPYAPEAQRYEPQNNAQQYQQPQYDAQQYQQPQYDAQQYQQPQYNAQQYQQPQYNVQQYQQPQYNAQQYQQPQYNAQQYQQPQYNAQQYQQLQYNAQQYQQPQQFQQKNKPAKKSLKGTPGRGFGISSMVLGIIACVYALGLLRSIPDYTQYLSYANFYDEIGTIVFTAVLGGLALAFALVARSKGYRHQSTAGLIMGIVSLSIMLISAIALFANGMYF